METCERVSIVMKTSGRGFSIVTETVSVVMETRDGVSTVMETSGERECPLSWRPARACPLSWKQQAGVYKPAVAETSGEIR